MISNHTLDLLWYKNSILYLWSKYTLSKNRWTSKYFQNSDFGLESVDRSSTVDRVNLLCRSTEWSTDRRDKFLCRLTDRSTVFAQDLTCIGVHFGRPTEIYFVSVGSRSIRRSTPNPTVRFLTIGGWSAGRPTERFSEDFSQRLVSILSFLGHIPTALCFLYMFSSPINRGTVEKPYKKLRTIF